MYEIALTVSACLRTGTRVDVAWAVSFDGPGPWDRSAALAITPGGGRVGSVLGGSANDQLVDLAHRGVTGRLVRLSIGDWEAQLAGRPAGGQARCGLLSAADLPAELWERLRERAPVGLVLGLDGDQVRDVALFDADTAGETGARLWQRAMSDSVVEPDRVTTVLWPVPRMVIVGGGPIADALTTVAGAVGWHPQTVTNRSTATGVIAGLAGPDKVVVMSHDDDLCGAALQAALAGSVGYIGSVGRPEMQRARADWLAYRGITDIDRIHGPAGLDIGASTPAEIAVSIVAEAVATSAEVSR